MVLLHLCDNVWRQLSLRFWRTVSAVRIFYLKGEEKQMLIKDISNKYGIDADSFEAFLIRYNFDFEEEEVSRAVKDDLVDNYVKMYKVYTNKLSQANNTENAGNMSISVNDIKENCADKTVTVKNSLPKEQQNKNMEQKKKSNRIVAFDVVFQINSIRRMGLISIICAVFNPLVTLICAKIGKRRCDNLKGIPVELKNSYYDALKYNNIGVKVSTVLLILDIVITIVVAFIIPEI